MAVQHSFTVSSISSRQAQLQDTTSNSREVSWLSMMAKLSMLTALSSAVLAKSVSGGSPGKTSLTGSPTGYLDVASPPAAFY